MKIRVLFTILFFGICVARGHAATDRNLLIQKELDCFSQGKNSGLTWADVCSMPAPTPADKAVKIRPQKQEISPSSVFNTRVNTFILAEQPYYYHYSEPDKARKYTGFWNGFVGKYIFRPPQGNILNNPLINYYALEGTYATGKSDKEGNIYHSGSAYLLTDKNIPGYMFDLRTLLGRDFTPLSYLRLTPYVGWGVRYKTDNSAGHFDNINGALGIGYNRTELYYYVPIGLTADVVTNKDYEISLNAEYDNLVKGYERNKYSDADQFTIPLASVSSDKALFAQDHGFGLKFSLKFLKHLSSADVFLEPFVDYWHIDKSKGTSVYLTGSTSTVTANKNSTVEAGIRLGAEF